MIPCRDALIAAMGLSNIDERRRNVKLLIEGNVPPPASIIFTRLLRLLSLATSHTHSRRNELTAVRSTLLLAPVLMGSGRRDDATMRTRGDSNDNMELQDAVEAAEVMRMILEDVDFYVEGLSGDIESRKDKLKGRVGELNALMETLNRKLDVRLVKEGDDDDAGGLVIKGERFVEGGIGECGSEDVEIVADFLSIVVSKGEHAEALEGKEGSAILEDLNIFGDTKSELSKTSVISLLSLAHFASNYERQAADIFEKLGSGLPTISQMSEQFVSMVGKATGIGGKSAFNVESVREVSAPSHFFLLCSKDGSHGGGRGGKR